ncbi:hypothetical protein D3C86_1350360 [compost metagenome]
MKIVPSPKVHNQLVIGILAEEVSMKVTVNGSQPLVSFAINPVTGGVSVTAGELIVPGQPFAPVIVRVTV